MDESIFEMKTLRMTILLVDAIAMVGTRSRAIRRSTFKQACKGKKGGS
jgi:hypothetical protein